MVSQFCGNCQWKSSGQTFWTNQCQPFLMVSMTQVQGAQSTAATDLSIIKGKCIQVLLTFLECQVSQTLLPNSNRSSSPIPKELLSPVIPLHKRTPCISCLENAGWHLSTLRNGSPCKQCLQLFAIVAVLLCSNWQGTSAPV